MNVGELRKMTNQFVPDETPVMAKMKDDPDIPGDDPMLTVKGAEYELHEESGTWTLWLDVEES